MTIYGHLIAVFPTTKKLARRHRFVDFLLGDHFVDRCAIAIDRCTTAVNVNDERRAIELDMKNQEYFLITN